MKTDLVHSDTLKLVVGAENDNSTWSQGKTIPINPRAQDKSGGMLVKASLQDKPEG